MLATAVRVKTLRELWIELSKEGLISVGYQAFSKWARSIDIEAKRGILPEDEKRLRGLAAVKQAGVKQPTRRRFEKDQIRQQLMSMGKTVSGWDVIRLAELNRVCDRTTLYKRAKRAGLEFSSAQEYPTIQMIKLVLGATIA